MDLKIGNTPIIKIKYRYGGEENHIYTKLESYNLTGSIKDRVAYYIIKQAYEQGKLRKGMEIVETTSGNTGIGLAAMGAYFGNPVHIFMTDWVSKERKDLLKMFNAKITLISKEEGGFKGALERAAAYAKEHGAFYCNQFENESNVLAHYETTGKEILDDLGEKNIGGFVSGIGTGGTLMGVAKRLKEANNNIKIIALEPDKMPILSQNKVYSRHKIQVKYLRILVFIMMMMDIIKNIRLKIVNKMRFILLRPMHRLTLKLMRMHRRNYLLVK